MLGYNDKGLVVECAAALGIVMNQQTKEQTFFNKHSHDVVSFALHPNRTIAATGQMA